MKVTVRALAFFPTGVSTPIKLLWIKEVSALNLIFLSYLGSNGRNL